MRCRRRSRPTWHAALAGLLLLPAALSGCSGGGSGGSGGGSGGGSATASGPDHPPGATGAAAPRVVATVARDLPAPWGLVRLPDGDLLVGLRDAGTIQHVAVDSGAVTEAGPVPGVVAEGEGGLLGLALDPDFADGGSRFVYAYHTTARDNRVTRFRYEPSQPAGGRLGPAETVLAGIPRGGWIHNGGGLAFGPDGMLYVATGDTDQRELAQDETSLAGKILRVDPDTGRPPPDNPDPASPVYSLGHRNVQGLAWDAEGRMFATEFGQDTWDELNRIEPGGNYGWPEQEGVGGADAGFVDPIAQWEPDEASPSGLAFSRGALWAAALAGERLWRVPLSDGRPAADPTAHLAGEFGRFRAVLAVGGDELLAVTNETDSRGTPQEGDDRILRLRLD